jgi:hypothetical protein
MILPYRFVAVVAANGVTAPPGFFLLLGSDGKLLKGSDGAYLYGAK